ncbi:MAG: hypothetical protein IT363_08175 [Methanoregulaceae archaeon]|nr:hypothetical protein [Methanoregulaceae archaeon]
MKRPWMGLMVLAVVGCSSRPHLAGDTWATEMMNFPATLAFEGNGSHELRITSPLGDIVMRGTYSETDETVSLVVGEIDVPPAANPGTKMLQRLKGAPLMFKLEWVSGDEVTLRPQGPAGIFGNSLKLQRKKN